MFDNVDNIQFIWNSGDVFRAPKWGMLLSVLAGVGLQVQSFSETFTDHLNNWNFTHF